MDTKDRRTGRTTRMLMALPKTGAIVLFPNLRARDNAQQIFDAMRKERGDPLLSDNFSFVVVYDARSVSFAGETRPVFADHTWFEQVPAHRQELFRKIFEPQGGVRRGDDENDAYAKRLKQDTDMSKAANALGKRLIDAIAKYHERNGVRPTHMEVTEEELLIIGPHLGGYWHLGNKEQKLDGVGLVVVKRRMGRAAEPVIAWEEA